MGLSLQLVQRQTQRLIMTPQMQQSIQLLQMNAVELEQLTQEELLENPFLQVEEDRGDGVSTEDSPEPAASPDAPDAPAAEANGAEANSAEAPESGDDMFSPVEADVERLHRETSEAPIEAPPESLNGTQAAEAAPTGDAPADVPESTSTLEDQPEQFQEVDVNWEEFFENDQIGSRGPSTREAPEETRDFSEYTAARESLYEHIMWQLRLSTLEGVGANIGEYLVGCMDDNGFLDPEAIAEAAMKFKVEHEEIERVLTVVQEFEPVGVGARSSAECLLLQMKFLGSYSETAKKVLEEHFEALQRKKFKEIAKAVETDESEILDIYHKVGRLEPRPGRTYSKEAVQYITPDVHVKEIDNELSIYLNEGRSGHLSVNRLYRRLLRMQERALTKEEKAYALEKFRGALMLIKNIEKRKSTVMRVTEAIMEVQRDFLDKGVEALKPLTLREVAEMVGMHESTIARVTSRKYVETPQGVFPLKYFFSSAIESTGPGGQAVSSRSIKDKIVAFIEQEDAKKPLSDQKIAEMLNAASFSIARRTVAKYREQLKILPAKLRREA